MHGSDVKPGERVKDVHFTEDTMAVDLVDGRTIVVPLAWYPRLLDATPEQRANWKISGAGYGIHWPEIDEDLSTEGLLRGAPAASQPIHAPKQAAEHGAAHRRAPRARRPDYAVNRRVAPWRKRPGVAKPARRSKTHKIKCRTLVAGK